MNTNNEEYRAFVEMRDYWRNNKLDFNCMDNDDTYLLNTLVSVDMSHEYDECYRIGSGVITFASNVLKELDVKVVIQFIIFGIWDLTYDEDDSKHCDILIHCKKQTYAIDKFENRHYFKPGDATDEFESEVYSDISSNIMKIMDRYNVEEKIKIRYIEDICLDSFTITREEFAANRDKFTILKP